MGNKPGKINFREIRRQIATEEEIFFQATGERIKIKHFKMGDFWWASCTHLYKSSLRQDTTLFPNPGINGLAAREIREYDIYVARERL